MFRDCIDSALSCTLRLLLSVPATQTEVLVSLGKLLAAIITTLGPELAGNGNGVARHRFQLIRSEPTLNHNIIPGLTSFWQQGFSKQVVLLCKLRL